MFICKCLMIVCVAMHGVARGGRAGGTGRRGGAGAAPEHRRRTRRGSRLHTTYLRSTHNASASWTTH